MTTEPTAPSSLTSGDEFIAGEGKFEVFEAIAIKEVLPWQIMRPMMEQMISRKGLAEKMHTSRSQVRRLLDPKGGNVTHTTLQLAAEIVGRKIRIELV